MSVDEAVPTGLSLQFVPFAHCLPSVSGVSGSIGTDPPSVLRSVQPLPKGDQVLNFSDAEDLIDDSKLK